MTAIEAKISQIENVDRVGRVEVCVSRIPNKSNGQSVFLQVVSSNGDPFRKEHLDDMALSSDDISELMELCFRKFSKICYKFLPNRKEEEIIFVPDRYGVDENDFVRVEFRLEY